MNRVISAVVMIAALMLAWPCAAQTPAAPATGATKAPAKQAKPRVYDEKADGKQQIADALARAKKENRRVLIQWGANWCGWCIKLHETMKSEKEVARKLQYEYDLVHIDIGNWDKHMDLAEHYGADLKNNGVPFLTILDADGNVLANQDSGSLEREGYEFGGEGPSHDPKKLMDFLTKHQAPYLNADDVLKQGLARAKEEDKTVLLHFGAPWCGWCRRFEAWLGDEEVAKALAEDFIDIKIDTDRTVGGKAMLLHYAESDRTGIPWYCLLDAEGKVLATSFDDKGQNIGCPVKEEEVSRFRSMLTKAAKRLKAEDLERITAKLQEQKSAAR